MADESSERMEQQVVDAIRTNQAAFVEAVRSWAEWVQSAVPDVPTAPLSDTLPDPTELVDRAFDFATQLLTAQREFTHELLQATAREKA